jgi:hypothetical protein
VSLSSQVKREEKGKDVNMKLNVENLGKAIVIFFGLLLLVPNPAGATDRMVVGELITSTS